MITLVVVVVAVLTVAATLGLGIRLVAETRGWRPPNACGFGKSHLIGDTMDAVAHLAGRT